MERRYGRMYKNLFGIGAVVLCVLLLLPSFRFFPAGAQSQPVADTSRDEFDARILVFFDALAMRNSTSAFNELLRSSPLGTPDASESLTAMQSRIDELQTQFGNILLWEKLDTKRIGSNIVLVRYVLMYDHYPTVWTFTFYRKPTTSTTLTTPGWVLVELHFETDMKSLL